MLNMESKVLLDICQELGYDVKNQLSGLDPDQRDAIEQRVKRGHGGGTATLAPPKPTTPLVGPDKRMKALDPRPRPQPPARSVPPTPPPPTVTAPPPPVERPAPP